MQVFAGIDFFMFSWIYKYDWNVHVLGVIFLSFYHLIFFRRDLSLNLEFDVLLRPVGNGPQL